MNDAALRMDRMYRFQCHIYDLTRRPYLLGRTTLINGLCPPREGSILEVGCGTAWNLLKAAETYPDAQLFGFDVSTVMLDKGHKNIAAAGLQHRIHLSNGDATAFAADQLFNQQSFDRVFCSYTLSMIPAWEAVLVRALDHLGERGQLHIVDFGDGTQLPTLARVGLHAWLNTFDVTPRSELRETLSALTRERGLDVFHTELYAGYAQYAVIRRV